DTKVKSKQNLINLLIKKPFILAGIATIVGSIIIKLIAKLTGFQLMIVFIFNLLFLEGIVYIVLQNSKSKMESIVYMMDRIKNKDLNHTIDISNFEGLESVSSSLNSMIIDLQSIMGSLKDLSLRLVSSSNTLNNNSGKLNEAIDDIALTTNEIANGASEQAAESEKGVALITNLSNQ